MSVLEQADRAAFGVDVDVHEPKPRVVRMKPLGRGSSGPTVRYYVFVRTTFDLPSDLFREAKAKAAERGESLKTFVTRALAAELGRSSSTRAKNKLTRLPVFGDPSGPLVDLTNADIARALSDERPVASRKPRLRDAS